MKYNYEAIGLTIIEICRKEAFYGEIKIIILLSVLKFVQKT
jgi:hypothetical protein